MKKLLYGSNCDLNHGKKFFREGSHETGQACGIIILKETHETYYWLELLKGADLLLEGEFSKLSAPCNELRIMLIASINTAKERAKSNE